MSRDQLDLKHQIQMLHSFCNMDSLAFLSVAVQYESATTGICKIDGIFVCVTCGRRFKDKYVAQRHFKLVHQPQQQASCHICGKTFKSEFYRNEHRTKEHRITVKMATESQQYFGQ